MRKVIASINVSLDNFMAGPQCVLDWHFEKWGSDLAEAFSRQLAAADTILLGRVTYCAMAHYWPVKALDLTYPMEDIAFAHMMNSYTKIVFSSTRNLPPWSNAKLARGDVRDVVLKLKRQRGKDIIIYGSSKLLASLIQFGLIDEYVLWVHPIVLGNGKPLFQSLSRSIAMELIETSVFNSGVVKLWYRAEPPGD
jgi:dihydrofolate reductase